MKNFLSLAIITLMTTCQVHAQNTDPLYIDPSGKVGIGTSIPQQRLHVAATVRIDSSLLINGNIKFTDNGEIMSSDKNHRMLFRRSENKLELREYGDIIFSSGATSGSETNKMMIRANGNVGIGTSDPKRILEVNNAMRFSNQSADINDGVIGTRTFDAGLNIVGINTDGQGRKITYWGSFIQRENASGNIFSGNSTFSGNSIFSSSVGIGTNNPTRAKLEVLGYPTYEFAILGGVGTLANGKYGTWGAERKANWGLSIYADAKIAAYAFVVPSDMRIKKSAKRSDSRLDLETINKIEVTDYQMRDVIAKGDGQFKKVIAQQVEDVYPQAVFVSSDVVPDIYQSAQLKNGWIKLATDLKIGEKVQIISGNEKNLLEVLETNESGFRVATTREGGVFVYGREVDDFLSVDYEAISMLNISATQELAKQVESLQAENRKLQAELLQIKKDIAAIKLK